MLNNNLVDDDFPVALPVDEMKVYQMIHGDHLNDDDQLRQEIINNRNKVISDFTLQYPEFSAMLQETALFFLHTMIERHSHHCTFNVNLDELKFKCPRFSQHAFNFLPEKIKQQVLKDNLFSEQRQNIQDIQLFIAIRKRDKVPFLQFEAKITYVPLASQAVVVPAANSDIESQQRNVEHILRHLEEDADDQKTTCCCIIS